MHTFTCNGELDLLVGSDENSKPGNIRLYINTGSASTYKFTDFSLVTIGTVPISFLKIQIADLDMDGKKDLIVAEGNVQGSSYVHFFKNSGSPGAPRFLTDEKILKKVNTIKACFHFYKQALIFTNDQQV